jgi:putative ABC transport system permease protein
VAGIFVARPKALDRRMLKMHLASAARLAETDRISTILLSVAEPRTLAGVKRDVERRLAQAGRPLRVSDWASRAPFYSEVRSLYSGVFAILGALIFLLVCLAGSRALLVAMMERVSEIGTLKALGTSRGQVGVLFLLEALWMGGLGALAGGVLALLAGVVVNAVGTELPPLPGGTNPLALRVAPAFVDFLWATALMLCAMAVSSLAAILRATRLRIVDALGHA